MPGLQQHDDEIQANLHAWRSKPLLREIYSGFYARLDAILDRELNGAVVELGSGIGNLKEIIPDALCTDLFPNPWIDVACDAYALPFVDGAVSNLVLFDVFHHLRRPLAFLDEARRVLAEHGRLILFEPYISFISAIAYGPLHHEPIAWHGGIDDSREADRSARYYAAQGNATRIFYGNALPGWQKGWRIHEKRVFSDLAYLLSGGFSKPALYPARWLSGMQRFDGLLSNAPRLFGARCLICLQREA